MSNKQFDLVIIGGGTAGLTAVIEALYYPEIKSIALMEKNNLGGSCSYFACVPTKVMLTAAAFINKNKTVAPLYGVNINQQPTLDFKKLMEKKEDVVHDGGYPFMDDPRVTLIKGHGAFISPTEVQVNDEVITGKKFVIATGARPRFPHTDWVAEKDWWSFEDATTIDTLPKSLAIFGAGAVGVEFAYIFASFGVEVLLMNRKPRILMTEEPEIADAVENMLTKLGGTVQCGEEVSEIKKTGVGFSLVHKNKPFQVDEILSGSGLSPNTSGLNLDKANVTCKQDGSVVVDGHLKTSNPNVYAVGDVVDNLKFTHVADYQAEIAVRHGFGISNDVVDYDGVGWGIYTSPAIGHAGDTEEQAKAKHKAEDLHVVTVKTSRVSRYRIESFKDGLLKVIFDKKNHTVIGGHIFAPHAEEIAQYLVLAIRRKLTVTELLDAVYIYPAHMQLVQKALEDYREEVLEAK